MFSTRTYAVQQTRVASPTPIWEQSWDYRSTIRPSPLPWSRFIYFVCSYPATTESKALRNIYLPWELQEYHSESFLFEANSLEEVTAKTGPFSCAIYENETVMTVCMESWLPNNCLWGWSRSWLFLYSFTKNVITGWLYTTSTATSSSSTMNSRFINNITDE
jgi:hypothetical protein